MPLVVRAVAGVIRFGQQGDPHRQGLAARHSIGQASMARREPAPHGEAAC
jgi:hypothetical protein